MPVMPVKVVGAVIVKMSVLGSVPLTNIELSGNT
jgi:hypothetical protein